MNEAQFLISIGHKNVPLVREGLQSPPIIASSDTKNMVMNHELDGLVYIKGKEPRK